MGIGSKFNINSESLKKNINIPTPKGLATPVNPNLSSPESITDSQGTNIKWNTDRIDGPGIKWNSGRVIDNKKPGVQEDRRVRLTMKSIAAWNKLFGLSADSGYDPMQPDQRNGTGDITTASDILAPLHPEYGVTNGLIFPYTPVINYQYIAEWNPYGLVHTNYQNEAFNRSYPSDITVTGQFTAQDVDEARYSLAAIHFFRTITKMYYGTQDGELAGTPPPTLLFSGHGDMMFNDVPVVVKSFLHDLLPDADYVEIETRNGSAWVPTVFQISITLGVQQDLIKVRDEFSLTQFASGKLLGKGGYL